MSDSPEPSPIRWGVPEIPDWAEAAVEERFDRAVARGVPIFLHGPAGVGKTTFLARWVRDRPELAAIWLSATGSSNGGPPLLDLVSAALGMASGSGWHEFDEPLRQLGRGVVVIEGAERLDAEMDFDLLVRELERFAGLIAVFVSRAPLRGGHRLGPARAEVIPSDGLKWDVRQARRALAANALDLPLPVVAQTIAATDGVPRAILDVAALWLDDRGGRLPESRRSISRLAAMWALNRAEDLGGSAAVHLLLAIASLLEVPRTLLPRVLSSIPGADDRIAARLVAEGHLAERSSVFSGAQVLMVTSPVRGELSRVADERALPLVHAVHAAAADDAGARELEPFHRARSGDTDAAVSMVLRRWHGDRVPGGTAIAAVIRALPLDAIATHPVLAGLRVALAGIEGAGAAERTGIDDVILSLDDAALDLDDPADRLLLEAARAEVLSRRGMVTAAIQRAQPLVEWVGEDVASLSRRGRRAYSYLLVVLAEGYATLLAPARAMGYARRVLAFVGPDRWAITKYRASAIVAFAHLFAAEQEQMRSALAEADLYFALNAFEPSPIRVFQWLAQFGDAMRRGDVAVVEEVAGAFAAFGHDDPLAAITAQILGGGLDLMRGDVIGAETKLARVVAGPAFGSCPPAIRALAIQLVGRAALIGGHPGRTLEYLQDAVAPPGHALCFDGARAAAYLAIGQPQTALNVTHACVAMGTRHSAESLAEVLLFRSVAHLELRHPDAARADAQRSLHLLPEAWRERMLGMLPAATLSAFAELLGDDSDLEHQLLRLAMAEGGGVEIAPTLSRKELQLLELLTHGLPLQEIAQQLYVSINTVKTQCRSLYRKLGVSSRHEAVDRAFVRGGAEGPPTGPTPRVAQEG